MPASKPKFGRHKPIKAEVIETHTCVVNDHGWADIGSEKEHHAVAWVEFSSGAPLRTTTIQGDSGEVKQSYVQKSDGNVNIGPAEEVSGKRVLVLVLDEMKD